MIVMMGCHSLNHTDMAEAFLEKGAKVCIGWSDLVLLDRTDHATTQLLEHLIIEKQSIRQAVANTNDDVGPDPQYNSTILYYPAEAGNYLIPTAKSSLTLSVITRIREEGFRNSSREVADIGALVISHACRDALLENKRVSHRLIGRLE